MITVQSAFHRHFYTLSLGHIPDWKCVLMWMNAFRATGNVSKERKGLPNTFSTPENMEQVHVSIKTGMGQISHNSSYPLSKKRIVITCGYKKMGPQPRPGLQWVF
ncbi:hypothetical protein TNCV_2575481 [Trichonephila clavipes]|uniref:Uncharacterized protein n=1 Tax=Trichonephila clavipes TaxID=2585209 RepID=A0A8X6R5L9_TRICX|nr:hypothetical protein TNCV_2575481 [Trichonephila clavipes]